MKRQLRNSKGQFALASAEVTAIRDEMKSEMKSLEAMFSQQMANMMGMIQNLTFQVLLGMEQHQLVLML